MTLLVKWDFQTQFWNIGRREFTSADVSIEVVLRGDFESNFMAELSKNACILDLIVSVAAMRTSERDDENIFKERNIRQHHAGFSLSFTVGAEALHDDG